MWPFKKQDDQSLIEKIDKLEQVIQKNNQEKIELQNELTQLNETQIHILKKLDDIQPQTNDEYIADQLEETSASLTKLGRMQYKANQQWQKEFQQLNEKVSTIEMNQLKEQARQNDTIQQLLAWLDDVDTIVDEINNNEQDAWIQTLKGWSAQLVNLLEQYDVYEINVIGTSFDPAIAEAVDTVSHQGEKQFQPYEIVKVLKRGFYTSDQKLIRKASVITYKLD